MLKNIKITQIVQHRINGLGIAAAVDVQSAMVMRRIKSLVIFSALIVCPGNPARAATGGLFISASVSEVTGSILLTGLSLAAFIFGLGLVLQSAMVPPTR